MNGSQILRIGIYSPYLSIMGGGERYILSIAQFLSSSHHVTIYSPEGDISDKVKERFHISLDHVYWNRADFSSYGMMKKIQELRHYDVLFYVSDGSLFFSPCKKNIMIIQSPDHLPTRSLLSLAKLRSWNIICYSSFMQQIIKTKLKKYAKILSPPIDTRQYIPSMEKKEKLIVTIGRFFPYPHNKKQDVLLRAFKMYYKQYFQGWKLIIAGGLTEKGGEHIVDTLRSLVEDAPIEIYTNPSFSGILDWYQKAAIYWHAAGYGEDLDAHPARAEHFGMTTVEAMACGAVPVVYDAGGQRDIIHAGVNGIFWRTPEELAQQTHQLISFPNLWDFLSHGAQSRAQDFSYEHFSTHLKAII